MTALDTLNNKSNLVPALASYYYAQTQNKPDTIYLVNYLDEHSSKDIDTNWWWMWQASYIAKNTLKDNDRALELAYKLSKNKAENAPIWTRELPAFLHEEMGDGCLAFGVITKLIKESESGERQIKPEEINYMRYFINERLAKLKKQKFDPRKCSKNT